MLQMQNTSNVRCRRSGDCRSAAAEARKRQTDIHPTWPPTYSIFFLSPLHPPASGPAAAQPALEGVAVPVPSAGHATLPQVGTVALQPCSTPSLSIAVLLQSIV